MEACLRVEGVSAGERPGHGRHGEEAFLGPFSLEVHRGELVSLVGPSGCGKSALLEVIAGWRPLARGRVVLDGVPIAGPGPDRGLVAADLLLPWLSLWDNVYEVVEGVFPGRSKAEKESTVFHYLDALGLLPWGDFFPFQVPNHVRVRATLARALAAEPKVLLLDDPFHALDPASRRSLQDALLKLFSGKHPVLPWVPRAGDGGGGGRGDLASLSILMVTRDIDEALYLSDRVVVLSADPACAIKAIVDVEVSRPRARQAFLHSSVYLEARDRLLSHLQTA